MVEDSEKLINLWTNPLKSIALLPKNIKSSNANSKYFATFKIPPFSDGQNCLWRFTQRSFSIIIPCEIAGLKYSFFFPPIMFGSLPLWVRRVSITSWVWFPQGFLYSKFYYLIESFCLFSHFSNRHEVGTGEQLGSHFRGFLCAYHLLLLFTRGKFSVQWNFKGCDYNLTVKTYKKLSNFLKSSGAAPCPLNCFQMLLARCISERSNIYLLCLKLLEASYMSSTYTLYI